MVVETSGKILIQVVECRAVWVFENLTNKCNGLFEQHENERSDSLE